MQEAGFPAIHGGVMGGRLETLSTLCKSIDADFKNELRAEGGLFQFLFVPEANILKPVVEKLLKCFEANSSTFLINGLRLGRTLQDVLFICHLPIDGKLVLLERCPSDEAFKRVYPEGPHDKKRKEGFYKSVACDSNFSSKQRKIAILMLILRGFVMPSFDGNSIPPSFVALLEDVDSVSNYAWGAAMLSYLLTGIEKFRSKKKKHLDGNFWIFLVSII